MTQTLPMVVTLKASGVPRTHGIPGGRALRIRNLNRHIRALSQIGEEEMT
jgi:hypothetical protein